ncbi:IS5 family transposase [Burkholderia ambifaria]|nr:IS5 family transposase [Burkholderia ambifaria]
MAACLRVGSTARGAAGETASSREDRLLPCVVDSSSIRAVGAGENWPEPHRSSATRVEKHHIATDANGTPIAAILTGANRNDVTQLASLIEAIVPIGGVRGWPLSRPARVHADRGYDHDKYRRILHERSIPTNIAARSPAR